MAKYMMVECDHCGHEAHEKQAKDWMAVRIYPVKHWADWSAHVAYCCERLSREQCPEMGAAVKQAEEREHGD